MEGVLKCLILGICSGGVYALIALGYVIIYKATRVFPFSQAAVLLIGAYVMYQCLIVAHLPIAVSVFISLAAGAVAGLIIERLCMRPLIGQPILAPIVVTLGLMLLIRGVCLAIWGGDVYGYGEHFLPGGSWQVGFLNIPQIQIYALVIAMAVVGLLLLFFNKTNTGLAMRVTHEDHLMAQNLGINVRRVFQYTWVLACLVGVIAGMLLGNIQGVGLDLDANGLIAIAAALFGGLESIGGAIIAGLTVGILQLFTIGYVARFLPGETTMMVPFVFLLLILLFKPYGLFGLVRIERL